VPSLSTFGLEAPTRIELVYGEKNRAERRSSEPAKTTDTELAADLQRIVERLARRDESAPNEPLGSNAPRECSRAAITMIARPAYEAPAGSC
jgi:cytidylate kinase